MPFDPIPTEPDIEALCQRDEVLRILVEADRLLSGPHMWCQGNLWVGESMCIVGALFKARGCRSWDEISTHAQRIIQNMGAYGPGLWNDHPERTFDQVKDVFRRAIAERARSLTES